MSLAEGHWLSAHNGLLFFYYFCSFFIFPLCSCLLWVTMNTHRETVYSSSETLTLCAQRKKFNWLSADEEEGRSIEKSTVAVVAADVIQLNLFELVISVSLVPIKGRFVSVCCPLLRLLCSAHLCHWCTNQNAAAQHSNNDLTVH